MFGSPALAVALVSRFSVVRSWRPARTATARLTAWLFALPVTLLFLVTAQAATFTVTTTTDNGNNVTPTAGSLRAAIVNANNTPGTDTIAFSIGSGAQSFKPVAALPIITDPVVIDGTTQPGFAGSPIIELDGTNAAASVTGLRISAGNSTIKGLVINRFKESAGIQISNAGGNVISGNYIGTDLTGTIARGNFVGLVVGSPNNVIGGTTAAERNIFSGNFDNSGVALSGATATGNIVRGNYIGVDVTGTIAIPNLIGVYVITQAGNNMIGGATPGARNVISGNNQGVVISSSTPGSNDNKIQGNFIGTGADGLTPIKNDFTGVHLGGGHDNLIGGTAPGEGNLIASNGAGVGSMGILIESGGSDFRNGILGNSIHSTNGLGIDLGGDGVTPNDQGDVDTGFTTANEYQNYPVLTTVMPNGNNIDIKGSLNSLPNTQFRLEFFSNAAADPSGFGEGQTFLGAINVTTNGNGDVANFTFTVPAVNVAGQFITATATDPVNNTSEFSQAKQIFMPPVVQFSAASYNVQESLTGLTVTVTRSGDTSGSASVDFATVDGTAKQQSDYEITTGTLNFAPGDASKSFQLLINEDMYVEGDETLTVVLSNVNGAALGAPATATITITDDAAESPTNPIDDAQSFVYTHYHDFLSREPDAGGLAYWTGQITQCGNDQNCLKAKRVDVSNAFFYEQEFQQTGTYVFRLYRIAFGNNQPMPNGDNTNLTESRKLPNYQVFSADRARVVGGANLTQGQQDLANAFVARPAFINKYPAGLSLDQFVDAVLGTINNELGVNLNSQRNALIALGSRGTVVYRLADESATNPISNQLLIDAEYNRAFVATQYFGYLRRDSDIGGFLFWLGQVNSAPLRNVTKQHGLVCSFITSAEYQDRFGSLHLHSNAECDQ